MTEALEVVGLIVLGVAVWVAVIAVVVITFGGGADLRDREEGPQ